MKWYMQMTMSVGVSWKQLQTVWVSASLQSLRAPCCGWGSGLQLSTLGREADMLSLKNNIACYGQEKKLLVNITICLCLPVSVCLSHTTEALTPRRIKRDIFMKKCCGSFPHSCIFYYHEYITHTHTHTHTHRIPVLLGFILNHSKYISKNKWFLRPILKPSWYTLWYYL